MTTANEKIRRLAAVAIDNLVEVAATLQRANAELTARAERAEKESERLRAMLAIGGAVGCLDRRREECEGCDDYDTCTASSANWPETPTQAKDEQ